jgi:adenylylsulfate kinase-like enzyme
MVESRLSKTKVGRAQMHKKILIMGLPGAGKTTLARHLTPRLNAVHYNADDVRANVNRDLGFSESDRVEHARRMGWLCDQVVKAGCFTLADFICPTPRARGVFRGRTRLRDLDGPDTDGRLRGYKSIVCAA